ncbi:hypothetical protein B5G28_07710 [Faecalibacterium sp. An77]|uniref:GLUG motif-containing protein n=1 Tax=Faecalibacterium sp. An77 TaxID=1965655 RepID=UPI000B37C42E|nr:GLUG motif-containing protein [Faecalibacterium sp. An77]OUN38835.1 hypothetical protein B5G28_07710 [Faecalibacterium sp. An77]
MTCMKKLTALLVSAALALSLLAGCGGSKALSQVIADLLSGMYNNVTVEVDPDLTAALKKAAAAGSTQEEVLAALVEELNLSGVRLTLRQLEEGRQGDHGVELVFQPGTDPDAAARSAVNGWASAFGALPDDGSYTARVAMIEAEGGYYIAVDVEVLKAGTPDKDDPEPKPDYTYDEASNTYTVYTAAGLQKWAEAAKADPSTSCTLGSNITITGEWTPIGTRQSPYTGAFDGQGHTIFGLSVSSSDDYAGLFGYIGEKGKVQNLTLDSPIVSSTNADGYVGAVAGENFGAVENCHVTGSVTATGKTSYAGGVVGVNYSTVTACYATGKVESDNIAGGVVGWNDGGTVTACYATGDVTATSGTAGGVVGVNYSTVTACYAAGDVTGDTYAGGVVGGNTGTVTACYATGTVTSTSGTAGGVVGLNYSTVTACYWSCTGPTHGIGDSESDINATKVDGSTVTWKTAFDGNESLAGLSQAAGGWYTSPVNEKTPPKLNWETP